MDKQRVLAAAQEACGQGKPPLPPCAGSGQCDSKRLAAGWRCPGRARPAPAVPASAPPRALGVGRLQPSAVMGPPPNRMILGHSAGRLRPRRTTGGTWAAVIIIILSASTHPAAQSVRAGVQPTPARPPSQPHHGRVGVVGGRADECRRLGPGPLPGFCRHPRPTRACRGRAVRRCSARCRSPMLVWSGLGSQAWCVRTSMPGRKARARHAGAAGRVCCGVREGT